RSRRHRPGQPTTRPPSLDARSRFGRARSGQEPLKGTIHMTIKRNGSAVWSGGLKDGKGAVSTGSGVLQDSQYGFNTRFEDGPGTNPEELIGAAHAGCFTMALSGQLGQAGL